MQIDNDLLQSLTPNSPITLRLYRWATPTVSLGHFQQESDIAPSWEFNAASRVRRRTGGGAIVHDHEWTYSLAIPDSPMLSHKGQGLKGHSEEIYRAVHDSIVDGLRMLGWQASLSEVCNCTINRTNGELDPFLCFMRRSPVDVVIGADKILGSAQRRSKNGLLQHGSFILRRSEIAPDLPGLLNIRRNRLDSSGLQRDAHQNSADHSAEQDSLVSLDSVVEKNFANIGMGTEIDSEIFPLPAQNSPLALANLQGLVEPRAGLWLAEQIMLGVDRIFRCRWRLA